MINNNEKSKILKALSYVGLAFSLVVAITTTAVAAGRYVSRAESNTARIEKLETALVGHEAEQQRMHMELVQRLARIEALIKEGR